MGFNPVLQKCLFSAPFFLAEGREGRIKRPGVFPFIDIFWLRESPTTSPDVIPQQIVEELEAAVRTIPRNRDGVDDAAGES